MFKPICCPCGNTKIEPVISNVDDDEKPWPMYVATDYDGDSETYDYGVLQFKCELGHSFYISEENLPEEDEDDTL